MKWTFFVFKLRTREPQETRLKLTKDLLIYGAALVQGVPKEGIETRHAMSGLSGAIGALYIVWIVWKRISLI